MIIHKPRSAVWFYLILFAALGLLLVALALPSTLEPRRDLEDHCMVYYMTDHGTTGTRYVSCR